MTFPPDRGPAVQQAPAWFTCPPPNKGSMMPDIKGTWGRTLPFLIGSTISGAVKSVRGNSHDPSLRLVNSFLGRQEGREAATTSLSRGPSQFLQWWRYTFWHVGWCFLMQYVHSGKLTWQWEKSPICTWTSYWQRLISVAMLVYQRGMYLDDLAGES